MKFNKDKESVIVESKKSFRQRVSCELRRNWQLYVMVSVPIAFLIVFKYIPMYGVQIAFRDYKIGSGFLGSKWVGLKHFKKFLSYYKFKDILWNTLAISIYNLCAFPLPIILALLLNYVKPKHNAFKKTVQLVTYVPHFISTVVIVGMLIKFMDARSGMINMVVELFGGEAKNFLAYPEYFRHIYVWSGEWQGIGYASVLYISALASVPVDLHEAAIIDGANIRQRIWNVDLPCIMPTIAIKLILACGNILSVGYSKIYLMQNNLNIETSEIISTYVYKQGLGRSIPQYSYSTAVNLFVAIVNLIMLLIVNKITAKMSGNSLF